MRKRIFSFSEQRHVEKKYYRSYLFQTFTNFAFIAKEKNHHFPSSLFLFEQQRAMTILIMLLLMLVAVLDAQTLPQSYIRLSSLGESFQPANSIELLGTLSVSSLLRCGYGKNEHFH
jgi:hypothetical protein